MDDSKADVVATALTARKGVALGKREVVIGAVARMMDAIDPGFRNRVSRLIDLLSHRCDRPQGRD